MKKKMKKIVCSCCGSVMDPSATFCLECGNNVSAQTVISTKGKKTSGVGGGLLTVVMSLLLSVSFVLLAVLLFVHALNENVIIPDVGLLTSDGLTEFFDSWYSLALGGALVLIPLLLVVLVNTHRARRAFLAIGSSAIASALLLTVVLCFRTQILNVLSGQWQDALVNATAAFRGFCLVCIIVLIAIGATCVSVYSCIAVVKGGRHEKDN